MEDWTLDEPFQCRACGKDKVYRESYYPGGYGAHTQYRVAKGSDVVRVSAPEIAAVQSNR